MAGCADSSKMSVSELKTTLQGLGVTTSGSKEILLTRLQAVAPKGHEGKKKAPSKNTGSVKTKVKVKPAVAAAKLPKMAKAKASKKHSDDLGDLFSPVASLHGCLRSLPAVEVMKAVVGPGPCLLKAMKGTKKASVKALRNMVEAHEFECEDKSLGSISLQHRLVIRLYTAEVPVPLYRTLNAPFNMQTRSPGSIANQAPFMKLLLQAVRALQKAGKAFRYVGPAYRGVRVAGSPLLKKKFDTYDESFKVGSRLTFAAFTSLSLQDSTAENFGDSILFQFTRVHGLRIADLSAIPSELEILVEPPAVFVVKSCAKFHGVLSVVLEAVHSPLSYL